MAGRAYSFIDIAVLDEIRERFAAGDALALLDISLDRVIWANGPGSAMLGHGDVASAMGAQSGLSAVARRQVAAAPGFPRMRRETAVTTRIGGGGLGRPVPLVVRGATLPDGEPAVLLARASAHSAARTPAEIARQAVSGFGEQGSFAALVREDGSIAASTDGFGEIAIPRQTLLSLIEEVRSEDDRLVKRLVTFGAAQLAAGIARLTDDPALHLLIAVEAGEPDAAEETAARVGEQPEASRPVAPAVPETAEPLAEVPSASEVPAAETTSIYGGAKQAEDEPPVAEAEERPVPEAIPDGPEPAQAGEDVRRGTPPTAAPAMKEEAPSPSAAAVRFVWRTDADGRFTMISDEFAEAVGVDAGDISGRRFRDVATALGIDEDGAISGLLERHDTWSGRTVLWPVAGADLRVPVDLAALPIYDRLRRFEGFRGFGVARMADAIADPHGIGGPPAAGHEPEEEAPQADEPAAEGSAADAPADPFEGEAPAILVGNGPDRRESDKVIRLAEHRPPSDDRNGEDPNGDGRAGDGLSAAERLAFREIGDRLKRAGIKEPPPPAADTTPVAPEARDDEAVRADEDAMPAEPIAAETDEELAAASLAPESEGETVPPRDAAPAVADVPEPEPAPEPEPEPEPEPAPDLAKLDGLPAIETVPGAVVPAAFAPHSAETGGRQGASALLSGLPLPILVHTGDTLHYANREFLRLTGHDSVEAITEAGGIGALFVEGAGPGEGGAMRLRAAGGREMQVTAHLQSIAWRGRRALLLALKPVMPDEALRAIQAELAEMRTIVDTATDGIVLIDPQGKIRSISRPAEALFGMDSAEIEGKPFVSLFAMESQRSARDYLAGLSENGVASVLNDGREVIGREAQGRFIPLFMTIGRLAGEGGYCAVLRDITHWKRAEEELNQARARAERASSQKTEFLARVSHEVRTPLNAIIGFSELMLDEKFGPVGNDRYRDYMRDINRSGNHVLDLVNDLLDISKIEAGEQEMSYEAVALNDALAETVAMMQPQANRERVIIRSSFASRLPDVVADQRSVRQIALNLLSNAVRHTPAGGQIIVSTAYETSGDIVVRVRDTGIGMTVPEIDEALKPFKQINAIKRARGDGTGLGLPLTKALVEANRARFAISSSPGQGTLVEITFPSTRVLAD